MTQSHTILMPLPIQNHLYGNGMGPAYGNGGMSLVGGHWTENLYQREHIMGIYGIPPNANTPKK